VIEQPTTTGRSSWRGLREVATKEDHVAVISKTNEVVTLINVFTVEPQNQQKLVDLLTEATEAVMRHLPGFVSANIHKSLDGVRVANYAQWKSREHFEAMLKNPTALPHMEAIMQLAKFDAHLYEVSFVDESS
jgi:quinol monooxygenase YgiN